jgi:hypothetical protein
MKANIEIPPGWYELPADAKIKPGDRFLNTATKEWCETRLEEGLNKPPYLYIRKVA